MPPRRCSTLVLAALVASCIIFLLSPARSTLPAPSALDSILQDPIFKDKLPKFDIPKFHVPSFHFSFHKSPHKPPNQRNSTHGDSSWYSDWKWLNPFSSSVTFDEERIVLPPLLDRTPVYTYYESATAKDDETISVDDELLRTWQRAWWAKGFLPIILSEVDAMSHPLYETFQKLDVSKSLKFEVSRWLAWGHMGTGLLASWHCVPMGSYDDSLLEFLRRGRFEGLTRFDGLGAGLFAGESTHIDAALQAALSDFKINPHSTMIEVLGSEAFRVENPTPLAHYNTETVTERYQALARLMKDDPIKGRHALNQLINAHLHIIWQNTFKDGIAVLKPLPAHTTALIEPSLRLAKLLTECPETIAITSCPPNRPKCTPCVGAKMRYSTIGSFHNSSSIYTIGTLPHPYTLIMLNNQSEVLDIAHIRRHTNRDQWLTGATRDVLGDGRDSASRLVAFKDSVASNSGSIRSLWFAAEQFPSSFYPPPPPPKSPTNEDRPTEESRVPFPEDWLQDLEWQFGFIIPRAKIPHGESYTPVPSPDRWSKLIPGLPVERKKSWDPAPPTDAELAREIKIMQLACKMFGKQKSDAGRIVSAAEAWNLADTEAWKFVKAYGARTVVERMRWRGEESRYDQTGRRKGKLRWWST